MDVVIFWGVKKAVSPQGQEAVHIFLKGSLFKISEIPKMQNPMYLHWQKIENPQWGFFQNFKLHLNIFCFVFSQGPKWIGYFCLKNQENIKLFRFHLS